MAQIRFRAEQWSVKTSFKTSTKDRDGNDYRLTVIIIKSDTEAEITSYDLDTGKIIKHPYANGMRTAYLLNYATCIEQAVASLNRSVGRQIDYKLDYFKEKMEKYEMEFALIALGG